MTSPAEELQAYVAYWWHYGERIHTFWRQLPADCRWHDALARFTDEDPDGRLWLDDMVIKDVLIDGTEFATPDEFLDVWQRHLNSVYEQFHAVAPEPEPSAAHEPARSSAPGDGSAVPDLRTEPDTAGLLSRDDFFDVVDEATLATLVNSGQVWFEDAGDTLLADGGD